MLANKNEEINITTCEGCPSGNKCIYQAQGKVITREDGFLLLGDTHVEKNR